MNFITSTYAFSFSVSFTLKTGLLLRTGDGDEIFDNTIDKTPDDRLHINGHAWASLLRRALLRIEGGGTLASQAGKYDGREGVSPLWVESSLVSLPGFDGRPGIEMSRAWKAATVGHLYNQELVPPGIPISLHGVWYVPPDCADPKGYARVLREKLAEALWVIEEGIENLGGGWSYGFGRLRFRSGVWRELNLTNADHRKLLQDFDEAKPGWQPLALPQKAPSVVMPWSKYILDFSIAEGQVLAIHTRNPLMDVVADQEKLPDSFVFRTLAYDATTRTLSPRVVVTGKAIRQALMAVPIERRLRSESHELCYDSRKSQKPGNAPACTCRRCRWLGSTARSGILAVLDAEVPNGDKNTQVIDRIQLCEHSLQNIQLFSGEYLTLGRFSIEVLLDRSRDDCEVSVFQDKYLHPVLEEMRSGKGPDGWHRIGATSACTGQVCLLNDVKPIPYGA